jgi:4'-phosphopantetheinyl transferase
MLHIDEQQIDLWWVFQDDIRDERLLELYLHLLSNEEHGRMQRLHFARDRHCFLVTRALIRSVLSKYAPIAPAQWRFQVNAYGKPEVAGANALTLGLSFNVSHTDGLIVLGITRNNALGVDTEHLRVRPAPIEIAARFFSQDETSALNAMPPELRGDRFFQYWTAKEAYIKARGMGLSIPLDQFSVVFRPGAAPTISFDREYHPEPAQWRLWQWTLRKDYCVAVCAACPSDISPQLRMRRIVPLLSTQSDCAHDMVATSNYA